tara:strand:- start:2178 stop:2693 length:516 start_codon:yes stop_codon:yes gene_type:complete
MRYRYLKNWRNERILFSLNTKTRLSIIDNKPLTSRLTFKSGHNFKVNVIRQVSTYVNSLSKISNIKCTGIGIYRSVILSTNYYPDIYAYSFMLDKHISGKERFLKILGTRSLGTYILKPERFKKKETSYKIHQKSIHRITVYKSKKKLIYVNEIFPEDFNLERINILDARG